MNTPIQLTSLSSVASPQHLNTGESIKTKCSGPSYTTGGHAVTTTTQYEGPVRTTETTRVYSHEGPVRTTDTSKLNTYSQQHGGGYIPQQSNTTMSKSSTYGQSTTTPHSAYQTSGNLSTRPSSSYPAWGNASSSITNFEMGNQQIGGGVGQKTSTSYTPMSSTFSNAQMSTTVGQQSSARAHQQVVGGGTSYQMMSGSRFEDGNSTNYNMTGSRIVTGEDSSYTAVASRILTGEEKTYFGASRVVTGEEVVIGMNTIEGEERIISERIVKHEYPVSKKRIVEEVIEKVIIIPETITREEYIDEMQIVKETIIEVAKPIIQEKIVEVHEIEYRDKIIERVERVTKEKIKEVPKIEYQERIVEKPKIIKREKIVEVPEIEYRDVIIEKIVEIPEYREQIVIKEVPKTVYVDKPVAEYVDVQDLYDVNRNIPVPVEAVTTFEYQLVQFRPRVHKVQYPLYVPRFVEVPVSAELYDAATVIQLQVENGKLQNLLSAQALSLCDVENMATEYRRNDVTIGASNVDFQQALTQAWHTNSINLKSGVFQTRKHFNQGSLTPLSVAGTYEGPIHTTASMSYGQSMQAVHAASTTT